MNIIFNFFLPVSNPGFHLQKDGGIYSYGGPGSALGIATGYGLEGPGIESQWGKCGPPSLL
jgi:hypothetical protein